MAKPQLEVCCLVSEEVQHSDYFFPAVYNSFKNSIGDARTPRPGEIFFDTMRYRRNETLQRSGDFQSISDVKFQQCSHHGIYAVKGDY